MKNLILTLVLAALPGAAQTLKTEPLANPSAAASLQANWSAAPDGSPVMSWLEPAKNDTFALRYSVWRGNKWSDPQTVVAGRHFFHHPAEVPEVLALNDHLWMAHWIETPAKEGSEAEFAYVSSSTDGVHWTAPLMAHKDRTEVEHGLASMAADAKGEISLIWLITPKGEDGPAYLMRTVLDASGKEVREERLDADVCTCCPTAVVRTGKGLAVAYRGHTPADIRDIAVIRLENGKWSQPKIVNPDNWKIDACPINAASIAAQGDKVAVAWYTAAKDQPKVQIAFSSDAGVTFGKPVMVSTGKSFGYASVALDADGTAYVSWLEDSAKGPTRLLVRTVSPAGAAGTPVQLAEGGRMTLGYPKIFHSPAGTLVAWGNGRPGEKIQTARVK